MAYWKGIYLPVQETQVKSRGQENSPGGGNNNPLFSLSLLEWKTLGKQGFVSVLFTFESQKLKQFIVCRNVEIVFVEYRGE